MTLKIKPLPSGYVRVAGNRPCNWAQVPAWPCTAEELQKGIFPEAGSSFRETAEHERRTAEAEWEAERQAEREKEWRDEQLRARADCSWLRAPAVPVVYEFDRDYQRYG